MGPGFGEPIAMICQRCKTWVPGNVNFCPNCGASKDQFVQDGTVPALMPTVSPSPAPAFQPIGALSPLVLPAAGLRPGERVFQVWRAGLDQGYSSDEDSTSNSIGGLLLATDQRLIFLQEKGVLSKSYKPRESLEWGQMKGYRATSMLHIKGLEVQVPARIGTKRHQFDNLYEVDPQSLKPLAPWPVEQTRALLDALAQRRL